MSLRELNEARTPGETLEAIIAEASAFSEYDARTDDAFRRIVVLAKGLSAEVPKMLDKLEAVRGGCEGFDGRAITSGKWLAGRILAILKRVER
jgi:hypothetical protein